MTRNHYIQSILIFAFAIEPDFAIKNFMLLKEILSQFNFQCNHYWIKGLMQILTWAASDQGQATISAIVALGALSYSLRTHRLQEARELGAAILVLIILLVAGIIDNQGNTDTKGCVRRDEIAKESYKEYHK